MSQLLSGPGHQWDVHASNSRWLHISAQCSPPLVRSGELSSGEGIVWEHEVQRWCLNQLFFSLLWAELRPLSAQGLPVMHKTLLLPSPAYYLCHTRVAQMAQEPPCQPPAQFHMAGYTHPWYSAGSTLMNYPSVKTPWTIMLHECSLCYWGNPTFEDVLLWALKRLGQEEPVWLWELLESSHQFMISTHYQPVCTSLMHVVLKEMH